MPSVTWPMPNAKCALPKSQTPDAKCDVPNAKSQLPYAKGPNDILIDLGVQFDSKRWPRAPRRPPGGSQEGPKDKTTVKVNKKWYPEVPTNHFLAHFWMVFGVVLLCFC